MNDKRPGSPGRFILRKSLHRLRAVLAQNLDDPSGLAFGPEGHLYVTDARAGRILRFRPPASPALAALPDVVAGTALALRGAATVGARIDVFVNDSDVPTSTMTTADGHFSAGNWARTPR